MQTNLGESPLHELLRGILTRFAGDHEGDVATYIPELAKADPDWFGLCLVTADGAAYEVGDSRVPFTIQSISKPFAYGLALERRGPLCVREHVGVEPSGDAFNSISLQPGSGRPLNPMINAGAIAVSSLMNDAWRPGALDQLLESFGAFAGRPLTVDATVYESERSTGHRNRAIAHLLRNFGIVRDPVEEGLDLYFQQCSVLVTCHDLATMAATLANHGVNPVTGRRALRGRCVEDVLSVMTTCGMYNYAGQWLYDVGIPAKSGVSGGVLAVLPGRMGIAAFSPRLDVQGNSVRAVRACQALSRQFGLHLFGQQRAGRSIVRSETTLRSRTSSRVRPVADAQRLKALGDGAVLLELQGDLHFSGIERVQRRVWERFEPAAQTQSPAELSGESSGESSAAAATPRGARAATPARIVLLDFSRVGAIDPAVTDTLALLGSRLAAGACQLVFAGLPEGGAARTLLQEECPGAAALFADLDSALEACEASLLSGQPIVAAGTAGVSFPEALSAGVMRTAEDKASDVTVDDAAVIGNESPAAALSVAQLELARELDAGDLRRLEPLLVTHVLGAGECICRKGDPARHVYFLTRGTVGVRLYDGRATARDGNGAAGGTSRDGGRGDARFQRLAAFDPGSVFGEMAFLDGGPRSADLWTETPVEYFALDLADFDHLAEQHPALKIKVLRYLLRILTLRLRRANDLIAQLSA